MVIYSSLERKSGAPPVHETNVPFPRKTRQATYRKALKQTRHTVRYISIGRWVDFVGTVLTEIQTDMSRATPTGTADQVHLPTRPCSHDSVHCRSRGSQRRPVNGCRSGRENLARCGCPGWAAARQWVGFGALEGVATSTAAIPLHGRARAARSSLYRPPPG